MTREIRYERKLTESYMVIPAIEEASLNEKIMLRTKPRGLLRMEKYYLDGEGQYWFCISGRQSLEDYCKIHGIGLDFLERLIVSTCAQIEIMSKSLMSIDCLLLNEQQIFVSNTSEEIFYTAYPGEENPVNQQFRQLMEFMLTRLDHRDAKAVEIAYELYEKTLDEGYSLQDLRDSIAEIRKKRGAEKACEAITPINVPEKMELPTLEPKKKNAICAEGEDKINDTEDRLAPLKEIWRQWKEQLFWAQSDCLQEQAEKKKQKKEKKEKRKNEPQIFEPENTSIMYTPAPEPEVHPTICLSDVREHPDGLLLYEGYERFADIRLSGRGGKIGKSRQAEFVIDKETVSQIHATITYENQEYYLENMNSTNGTYVNEEPLVYKQRRLLKGNDIVRFADVKYRFI